MHYWWECKLVQPLLENSGGSSKKKELLTYNSGIYLKENEGKSYAYFHSSAYKPAQDYLQNDVFTVSEPHEGRDSSYYLAMRSTQQGLRYSRYSINACGRNRSLTISFPSMPHWPLPLSSSSTHPIQVNGIYQLAFKKLFYKYIKCIVIGLTELHKIMSLSIFFGGGIFPHLRFHNLLGVA